VGGRAGWAERGVELRSLVNHTELYGALSDIMTVFLQICSY